MQIIMLRQKVVGIQTKHLQNFATDKLKNIGVRSLYEIRINILDNILIYFALLCRSVNNKTSQIAA